MRTFLFFFGQSLELIPQASLHQFLYSESNCPSPLGASFSVDIVCEYIVYEMGEARVNFFLDLTANSLGQDICSVSTLSFEDHQCLWDLFQWVENRQSDDLEEKQDSRLLPPTVCVTFQDYLWLFPVACIFATRASVEALAKLIISSLHRRYNKDPCAFVFSLENILIACWEHLC